jgi:rhodanese-related sulfurtransferase
MNKVNEKQQFLTYVGIAVIAICCTVLLIYLTPLKHINLISPTMNEMDPKEFSAMYKAHPDRYELIDVRSPSVYLSAHAKGAISIPIDNMFDEHYTLPRHGKQLALICTSGRLAAIAYGYLQYWGFLNLIHIQGGMQAWVNEGLPIEGANVTYSPNASTTILDEHQ